MPRITVLEPDTLLSRIYARALRSSGLGVDVAASAQEAIHLADTRRPDLVVLELQLVAHNGIEFLYEFRSYPEWLQIPVIVHSFVPVGEFADREILWQELGVKDYLYKPTTSLKKLVGTVQAFVADPVV